MLTGDGVVHEPPVWAKRAAAHNGETLNFFDEVNTATPATQIALMNVVLTGHVGQLSLGKQVMFVAAANPPEQNAGAWDLSAPLANRFAHLRWPVDFDAWRTGYLHGWAAPSPLRLVVGTGADRRRDHAVRDRSRPTGRTEAARSTSRCERPATGSPCTAERYYRELHDTGYVEQIVVEVADGKLVHGRSGSGASGFDQPFELLDDAAGGLSSVELYLLRRNTAESVRDYEAKHGIGTLPNGLKRWADSQLEPKVDRRRTLTSALRRALHQRAGMADYSWRRPPRRQRPGSPLQFPGMVQPVPSLAVVMERIAARRSSSRWQYTQTRRSACVGRCSGALKRSTQIGAPSWRLPWQAIEARDTGCSSGSRLQVADNPSTPSEVMHRLVRDDTVLVRHAACASLRLRRRHLFGT